MRSKVVIAACGLLAVALMSTASQAQTEPPGATPPAPAPGGDAPVAPGVTVPVGEGAATTTPPTTTPGADVAPTATTKPPAPKEEEKKLPWHGSIFLLDQSFTSTSVGLGKDYISSNPVYELWYSFRPRYYFLEDGVNSINVNLRIDLFHELTNSDSSTRKNEPEFGDIWVNGVYQRTVYKDTKGEFVTNLSTGPRILLPTSKASWNAGNRLKIGWGAGARQALPLAGKGSTWFPGITLATSMYYTKFINTSTTPSNDNFGREVQDTGGRTLVSSQFGDGAQVSHQIIAAAGYDLDITEKLKWAVTYIWILRWKYNLPDGMQVPTATGAANVGRVNEPQNFSVSPWFLTNIDYDLIPEVGLGVGYYNLSNQIGPDGTRRNPFWSPDSRIFFDITANLDEIYLTAAGRNAKEKKASLTNARQQARSNMVSAASSSW